MHSPRFTALVSIAFAGIALAAPQAAQQTTASHAQHPDAKAQHAMGFDQSKTAHHFFLYEDGGAIEVNVKDKADKTNLDAIRSHLAHIALMFGRGIFDAPMTVHDPEHVPGISDLARFKDTLKYTYADTPAGGRVDIVTTDKDALPAVYAFLKFQIAEHKTGDATKVAKRK